MPVSYTHLDVYKRQEPQRWYYHCDRLGIVVWQDMVNGGERYKHWFVTYLATVMSWLKIPMRDIYPSLLSRKNKAGRLEFVREMRETVYVPVSYTHLPMRVRMRLCWILRQVS